MKADLFPGDEKYKKRMEVENAHMDDTALRLSVFGQRCFYNAFAEFDDQDIEMSLNSANLIVRIFAVLDRRVGKRRLTLVKKKIQEKSDTFQEFFAIRAKAEGLLKFPIYQFYVIHIQASFVKQSAGIPKAGLTIFLSCAACGFGCLSVDSLCRSVVS